jgi:hypothetical protein
VSCPAPAVPDAGELRYAELADSVALRTSSKSTAVAGQFALDGWRKQWPEHNARAERQRRPRRQHEEVAPAGCLPVDQALRRVAIACNLAAKATSVPVGGEVVPAWGVLTLTADSIVLEGYSLAVLRIQSRHPVTGFRLANAGSASVLPP